MKYVWGTIIGVCMQCIVMGQSPQFSVNGSIVEEGTSLPVGNSTISWNNQTTVADASGHFVFKKCSAGQYKLVVSNVGYKTYQQMVSVNASSNTLNIALTPNTLFLQPLEVKALRVMEQTPFNASVLTKAQIENNNLGQDLPFLLNQLPSVVVNSDAGNGVGYSGIKIRGTDASRINVTLNGIPYNDAESQGAYFVDIPDMASSLNSIQVQRGVGTSSNGTGAFGASINLSTNDFNEKAYAELNNSYGSFNTWKNTFKVGTGLINNHFTFDARLSQISSEGYIDRATTNLKSMALSGAYLSKKSSIRLNIFSGKEKTYQAWNGLVQDSLNTNRTFNSSGSEKPGAPYNNQTDNYQQDHYQIFFNHALNSHWSVNTAFYMTYGRGYYEEYKGVAAESAYGDSTLTSYAYYGLPNTIIGTDTFTNTDLVRQLWLENHFYGQIGSIAYKQKNDELTLGGGWSRYEGSHYGKIIWAKMGIDKDVEYYRHPTLKNEENVYLKWQHVFNNQWTTYTDFQYRHVYHRMNGFEGAAVGSALYNLTISRNFWFANPKVGIKYNYKTWQVYANYALANKEPNYSDFKSSMSNYPRKETLHDVEFGVAKKASNYSFGVNLYYMNYVDQLVPTGRLNDVGEAIRINVPNSYRLGVELEGKWRPASWVSVEGNVTLSKNKIQSFDQYLFSYDDYTQHLVQQYSNTDISFSPAVVGSGVLRFQPLQALEVAFFSKYVGKQYLDNTQSEDRAIGAYYTQDVRVQYQPYIAFLNKCSFIVQVNNVFNTKYLSTGGAYPYLSQNNIVNANYVFPMALANFMVGVNIKL